MKVLVASLMLVCTVGVGTIFADCGWIVWQIINKEEKNFWRVRDSVETYDGCRVSAETLAASFYKRAKSNENNVQVIKNEWTISVATASMKGESTELEATNVEFLCLPTSMDPRA